jgi:hypothetical protein
VVVRSGGGDVDAAMTMADAVMHYAATVVVRDICLSSCANYVVAAGRVRVVLPGAVLAFHGGAVSLSPAKLLHLARKRGEAVTPAQARLASTRFALSASRQATLLRRAHIAPTFLDWARRFDERPPADRLRACDGATDDPSFLLFAPALLASAGYRIDDYRGPRSAVQLRAVLARFGVPGDFACYLDTAG